MPRKPRTQKSPRRKKPTAAPTVPLARGQKQRFQNRLLKWYKEYGRDLPWRKTSDPYHILVSEVMLQQTQVDRVYENRHVIRRDLKAKREVGIDGQMCVGFDPAAFQGEI